MAWEYLWIFFVVALAACAIGFKKFVWFLSIGYGFAVAALAIAYFAVMAAAKLPFNWVTILQLILFLAYGARLSLFLLIRELKNKNYQKVLKEATKEGEKPMPIFVKAFIWIFVGALYVAQTCPVFYRSYNNKVEVVLPLIGVILSAAGLLIESLSDRQKSAEKAKNPNMVATHGLFKMVRCPNYFGEILFWTGVFVGGVTGLKGVGQWILAVIGFVAIVYIMFNGAQRLEKRQNERYGNDPAYRAYVEKTPIILPLLPIYHLNKTK